MKPPIIMPGTSLPGSLMAAEYEGTSTLRKNYLLNKLTDDHRMFFEIVKSKKEVLSNDLWEDYISAIQKEGFSPIAPRTFSEYMNKLRDLGLVKVSRARVRGKVKLFRTVD